MRKFDDKGFRELLTKTGLTPREIAFQLAEGFGVSITQTAVKAWLDKKNWDPKPLNFLAVVAHYGKGESKKAAKVLLREYFAKE